MNDNGYIELLPVAVTKHIQHSWLEVENHLKQAGNLMFKRYFVCVRVCSHTVKYFTIITHYTVLDNLDS